MFKYFSWLTHPQWKSRFFALGLWIALIVPGLLIGPFGLPFRQWSAGHRVVVLAFCLLPVLVVLASVLYIRRFGNNYRLLLWLGAAWSLLTVLFHLLFGHYVLRAPWVQLWADYRIPREWTWPLTLLTVFLIAPLTGMGFRGVEGLRQFILWLRRTRRGILTALAVWLFSAYGFHYLFLNRKIPWLAKFTVEGEITIGGVTPHLIKCSLVALFATFLLLFLILLLPEVGRSYWKSLGKIAVVAILFPFWFCLGSLVDTWFEITSKHLELKATFAAGEQVLLECKRGSYGALIGFFLGVGTWVRYARERKTS